jgi:(1->4)-alpha-D-glucan 1-alpha-D-glucosylmutase
MKRRSNQPIRIPSATYRLQFNRSFTFQDAADLVGYFDELGITDLYASPFLMARPGSTHGYDVTDHTRFNPEIGDAASFSRLSEQLRLRNMGILADVVPNHMCISHPSNLWWWDVLENGPSSPFAKFFDIDWHPPKQELANKVLLPLLGDQFGRVLENQEIQVLFSEGQLQVSIHGLPLPLAPWTWPMILEPAVAKLRDQLSPENEHVAELESIITALNHLPGATETDDAKIRERQRERDIVKRRLGDLVERTPQARESIQRALAEINGQRGNPRSFDRLERLLEAQAYRLSYWRVAMDEINYRRFFDINDLAAIRVEDPAVFDHVHSLILDHIEQGQITGLRIDHPDGLFDPERYFRSLQDAVKARLGPPPRKPRDRWERPLYIVAEKILIGNEPLRTSWAISGTTGYDFLNFLNGVFVDRTRKKAFEQLYSRFTGWSDNFDDLVCESKRLILQVAMSSELNVLARKLDRLSEQHRWYRDFTLENLRDALREVLAAFPVYRTYVAAGQKQVDAQDRKEIVIAIREAKRRNPAISASVFDFIASLLLLEDPDGLDQAQRDERHIFTMRFQQLSGPVMAKGVEDTAFYRYYPLASLNEVGGNPERFGVSVHGFHRRNVIRRELWPRSMNATSTHDTKRGEDVRARINVLSEMPLEWYRAVRRWRDLTRRWKTKIGNALAPDANEEYLFYQTLVGSWPLLPMNPEEQAVYTRRIQHYMEKALNEAKIHTSWINPQAEYNSAVERFIANALEPSAGNAFLEDFRRFQAPVARAGMWNSVSQVLLKIASPGVPDFYPGNELWNFVLVDPDNRSPVDYSIRQKMLASVCPANGRERAACLERLVSNPCDGAVKLYLTSRGLAFRKAHRALFEQGSYTALVADGQGSQHVVAFARSFGDQVVIVVAARFFLKLCDVQAAATGEAVWGNTSLVLHPRLARPCFEELFTGRTILSNRQDGKAAIPLAEAFRVAPFALLFSRSPAEPSDESA